MGYAIIRIQKIKHASGLRRSLKHALREQDTPNADAERTPENTVMGARSSAQVMAKFHAAMPDKVRSNAVLAVEYLVTASPESMNSKDKKAQDAYFSDALDWLKAKHGAENLLFAGVHRDETTPHMYAYIVPKVGDRLNARHYFGGAKALNELQTDFAARVGRVHGLERGLEGSKARHTSIKTYYGLVNSETPKLQNPTLPPTKFLESKAEYAIRAKEPLVEFANKYISAINAKNKDLQSKNTLQANELKAFEPLRPLRNALEPYSTSQVNEYVTIKTKDITKASENQVRDAMAKQAARDQQKRLEVQAAAERAAQLRQQQALERAARREVERIAQAKRDKENPSQGVER